MRIQEDTKYGPVRISAYLNKDGRVTVSVQDTHSLQPNWGDPVPPLVVNSIPAYGTVNLSANPDRDLTALANWDRDISYLKRLDKKPWEGNDATDGQLQKLYKMAEEEAVKLFENPSVLPLLRIESKEGQVEVEQKQIDKLRSELAQAEGRLFVYKKQLVELRKMGGYEKPQQGKVLSGQLFRVREDPKGHIFSDYEGGT